MGTDRESRVERAADGWCCLWQTCRGIGVPTVTLSGVELCVACWVRTEGRVPVYPTEGWHGIVAAGVAEGVLEGAADGGAGGVAGRPAG